MNRKEIKERRDKTSKVTCSESERTRKNKDQQNKKLTITFTLR